MDQDQDVLYDTIPASKIGDEVDVMELDAGSKCKALYDGAYYDVEILAKGETSVMLVPTCLF